MKQQIFRQGDVLIQRVAVIPKDAKQTVRGNPILAHGEVTGHHHMVESATARLLETPTARFLDIAEVSALTHQEHATITLPVGTYKIVRQREYSPVAIRSVQD